MRRHLPFALLVAGVGAYYFALYGDLLIFEEARKYIAYGGWINMEFPDWFERIFRPAPNFSRYTSTLFFWLTKGVCGYSAVCANGLQQLLILANGALAYVHVLQVTRDRTVAILTALLWYAGLGVLNSLIWQATSHDKLGLLFVLLAAVTTFAFLNRSGWLPAVACNLLGFFFVAFALNCKESTYVLVGLLPLQCLLFVRDRSRRGRALALAKIALPMGHAVVYVARYFAGLEPWWEEHILLNRSPGTPNEALMAGLFNVEGFHPGYVAAFYAGVAVLAGVTAVAAVRALRVRRDAGEQAGGLLYWRDVAPALYLLGWFAGAFLIALSPRPNLPYYLLIPSVGGYASAVFSLRLVARWLALGPVARGAAFALLLAPFLANHLRQVTGDTLYARIPRESAALAESYRELARVMPLSEEHPYHFSVPDLDDGIFLFGLGFDPEILHFVYGRGGDFRVSGVQGEPMALHEGAWDVFIAPDLGLEAVYFDRERVHPPDARGGRARGAEEEP